MKMLTRSTLIFAALSVVSATDVRVLNNCNFEVDPAFFPAVSAGAASTGGFPLAPAASAHVTLANGYSGRIWGRTGCSATGNCTTGGCPGGESCTGPAPGGGTAGPTLAQFTINGYASLDFFNPTVADGYNVRVTITPGPGCSTIPVACGKDGTGNGCGQTSTCPTGTNYTVSFCS